MLPPQSQAYFVTEPFRAIVRLALVVGAVQGAPLGQSFLEQDDSPFLVLLCPDPSNILHNAIYLYSESSKQMCRCFHFFA